VPIEQILEIGAVPFIGRGFHIREIVGNYVQLRFHRVHSGRGGVKCLNGHGIQGDKGKIKFKMMSDIFLLAIKAACGLATIFAYPLDLLTRA
jgi:hypothetical protein